MLYIALMLVTCIQCGVGFEVRPYRANSAKFCGYSCRGKWRAEHWTGADHPNWMGGERSKACGQCGVVFRWSGQPLQTWRKQKFCSKPCADRGGKRLSGEDHPNWAGGVSPRDSGHARWAARVIDRDRAQCQQCGAVKVELHAHHVRRWKLHPELRYKLSNGVTLCAPCHWAAHSASDENAVNSVNPQRKDGGNTEPSPERKLREGVTTRGRAYRRVEAACAECGVFISRQASDAMNKKNLFCSRRCMGDHYSRVRRHATAVTPPRAPQAKAKR